jgi:hypothetical protein
MNSLFDLEIKRKIQLEIILILQHIALVLREEKMQYTGQVSV